MHIRGFPFAVAHRAPGRRYFTAGAILLILVGLGLQTLAQGVKEATIKPPPERFSMLPEPLEIVLGNMRDFQQDGLFTITDARYDKIDRTGTDAFVWKLKTNRPVSCGHIEQFFNKLRDVRFYREYASKIKDKPLGQKEVLLTLLDYSNRIKYGAANRVILSRDQIIEVWIYMNQSEVKKLTNEKANRVIFSRYRR